MEESAEVSTGVRNEEAALRGDAEPARRGPHDSTAAQRAVQEWAARAQECRMKRVVARSSRLLRRNLPAERMLRRSVDAWALATVGRSLAQAHAMRQLLSRVLPDRRRRTASQVLRCAPLARELVRCTTKPDLPPPDAWLMHALCFPGRVLQKDASLRRARRLLVSVKIANRTREMLADLLRSWLQVSIPPRYCFLQPASTHAT